jgi:hypothetical protein
MLRGNGSEFEVKFTYATSPDASAVQWLSAKATSSGKYVSTILHVSYLKASNWFV